jgi:hypothetical protein
MDRIKLTLAARFSTAIVLFCGFIAMMGLASTASATELVGYVGASGPYSGIGGACGVGASPDTLSYGVTASNLVISHDCTGADKLGNIGSAGNVQITNSIGFGSSTGTISSFSFNEYNNDCENGGYVYCNTGANFELLGQLNGGATSVLATFDGGAPYTNVLYNFSLNLSLGAGDTYTFTIENTGPAVVGTAQYGFGNIQVAGTAAAPEPSSAALLFMGFAGLGAARKWLSHSKPRRRDAIAVN